MELEPTLGFGLREPINDSGQVGSDGDGNTGTNHKSEFGTTLKNIHRKNHIVWVVAVDGLDCFC